MDGGPANILTDSAKLIVKLQLLSAFFEDETIYEIYLRTQIIHQLFEHNKQLDINKLALFHLQYTTSAVELLKKMKKNNENDLTLLFDEIELNKEIISKIKSSIGQEKDFTMDVHRQELRITNSLRSLYSVLSNESKNDPLSKNINTFNSRYATDMFYYIRSELLSELVAFDPNAVYKNTYVTIQKKLMGLLCKYDFRNEFIFGLKSDNLVVEIYKFKDVATYFLFYPSRSLFLLCDVTKLTGIEKTTAISKKERMLQEFMNKEDRLKNNVVVAKRYIPDEVKSVLADYYRKIADVDFLQNISDVDVQSNILRSMLNTDML